MDYDKELYEDTTLKINEFISCDLKTKDFELWVESNLTGINHKEKMRAIALSCSSFVYRKKLENLLQNEKKTIEYVECDHAIGISEILYGIANGYWNCL